MAKIATKFKETEIGTIPEEWCVLSVGEIGRVVTGKTPPTSNLEFYGDDYFFVKIPDMAESVYITKTETKISEKGAEYLGRAKLPKNSIMVSCIATVGNVGITSEESFTNQQINSLIPDSGIADFKYLYYFFKANKSYLESLGGGGSVYINISKSKFENMAVVVPPIDEQTRIASILSSLDDKIELNRKINTNLEKIASALFKKWFVDGVDPDNLSEGWRIQKIGDVVSVKGGSTPDTSKLEYWQDGSIAWVTPKDLSNLNSIVLLDTEKKITESGLGKISSGLLPLGTILLSSRAPIGYVAVASISVAINQGFIAINANQTMQGYILFWVKNNIDLIESRANGSTFLEINKTNFRDIDILMPDIKTLKKFEEVIGSVVETIIQNECEIKNLSFIRDSLLPRLMSGKIRV